MIHMIFIFTFFLLSGAGSVQAADAWAAREEAFLAFSECRREQVGDAYTILSNFAGSVGVSIAMNSLHMLTPENQEVLRAAAFKEVSVFDDAFLTGYIDRYQKTIDTRYFNGLMAALVIIAARKLCDDDQPRYYPRKKVEEVPL